MLSGWLKDLAVEQIKDYQGVVPQIVPDIIDARPNAPALAVWGDVSVITPVDLYLNYGDKQILQNQYESMTTWLNAIPRMADSRLWDNSRHQLGDWLDPAAPIDDPSAGKTDSQYVANAYLGHVSNILATVTRILGHDETTVKKFEDEAAVVKQDFQHTYITPAGRLSPDTMTSLSLALTFGLFANQEQIDRGRSRLAELSRASRFRIGTGFAGTPTILPALCAGDAKKNFKQVAYRMLLETNCPSWLYPITMGATTMWERWDSMLPNGDINPGSMTSFNHYALGSVGKWLFSTVGGIDMHIPDVSAFTTSTDQSSIGWRTIKFAPQPGGIITWAKTSHLSPYGMISCDWNLDVGKKLFRMTVVVPPNCKGVVQLPGTDKEEIEVGSGTYEFAVEGYEEKEAWPPEAIVCPWAMLEENPQKIVGV
jgi:alpha-L-rhamnosidase